MTAPTIVRSKSTGEHGSDEASVAAGSASEPADLDAPLLPSGTRVGRYVTGALLGRGGMGEVYVAYDPELARRVAVKLLYTANDSTSARRRLLREARALGKLSHPNVVQVHDAGEHDGNVFLAMELVEGVSLDVFCNREPKPSWDVVLAAYLDAARGLAAAHAKGLVHCDIKPSNILRGNDGRTRVVDFGIAGGMEPEAPEPEPSPRPEGDVERLGTAETLPAIGLADTRSHGRVTRTGIIVGTPYYLAPEQHDRQGATPASDQYSLCVALHEGLHGAPLFTFDASAGLGAVLSDLRAQKLRGVPATPPEGSPVPAWVHRAIARGLSPEPGDRYPSIEALAFALSHDPDAPRRARRRRIALGAGAVALVAIAAAGWAQRSAPVDMCAQPERELVGVWDQGVKEKVRTAFLASGRPGAESTAARVLVLLDRQAAEWSAMRGEVCRASHASAQPPEIAALRHTCLDRRRAQLGALSALFAEKPDPEILDKAVQAASGLSPVAYCADTEALTARVRPPEDPAIRAQVAALEPRVDRLEALFIAGKYKEGAALGEPLLASVTALPYAPLRAQAQYAMGRLIGGVGEYDRARTLLEAAAASASEGRDDVLGALIWARLLFIVVEHQRRLEDAAVIRALGPTALARVHDDRALASWLNAEGLLFQRTARYAEARSTHERALALRERALGPEHIEVATSLNNLGLALVDLGDPQASVVLSRAVAIREKALGPEHPDVQVALMNLGIALETMGDFEVAKATMLRALTLHEKVLGPEHPEIVISLLDYGGLLLDMGDAAQAKPVYERALAVGEKAFGPEHPRVAEALTGIGRSEVRLGHVDPASALLERALAMKERALGHDHGDLAQPLLGLGEVEMARGKPDLAIPILERALALGGESSEAQLVLAKALWQVGKDRPRARVVAEQLRAYYARLGNRRSEGEVTRWLDAHR